MTLKTMMRENVFVGFCVFSVCLICELRAQQNGNVTSAVDAAAMTSHRDYANNNNNNSSNNNNETGTPVDDDVISGRNETGSVYVHPEQVRNDEGVADEELRQRNVSLQKLQSYNDHTQNQTGGSDSMRNNDSAMITDVFLFRNSSEEIAISGQKMAPADDVIEQDYHSNQTEKRRESTFEAILSTLTFATQGHASSTLPPGKQESFETVADHGSSSSSRPEIVGKRAPEVTEATDERVTEVVRRAPSAEYPSPVPAAVPRTSRRRTAAEYATTTTKGTDPGAGHVTPRDVTGSGVVVTKAAEFIYKNLWEEEGEGEEEKGKGSIGAGKVEEGRTGTSTESWKRRAGGGSGGRPSTLGVRGVEAEMEKARREEDAEHVRAGRHSFQWQDEISVLVPVLCGMFGAMSIVLAGYFLRNCPRNIRLLLFKAKDSKLKRRKSDLSLLIDNSSGDERP